MLVSRRETCLESMKRVSQREVRSIERRWKITGKWPFVTGRLPRIAYLSFAPCVVKGLSTRYGGTTDNVDRWIYFLRRFLFLFSFFWICLCSVRSFNQDGVIEHLSFTAITQHSSNICWWNIRCFEFWSFSTNWLLLDRGILIKNRNVNNSEAGNHPFEQRNYTPLRIIFLRIFFSSASNATIQGSSSRDVAVELIRGTYAGSALRADFQVREESVVALRDRRAALSSRGINRWFKGGQGRSSADDSEAVSKRHLVFGRVWDTAKTYGPREEKRGPNLSCWSIAQAGRGSARPRPCLSAQSSLLVFDNSQRDKFLHPRHAAVDPKWWKYRFLLNSGNICFTRGVQGFVDSFAPISCNFLSFFRDI